MGEKTAYVYIMGNTKGVLYIGFTTDLETRVSQHKSRQIKGFSAKYSTTRLLYFEAFYHPIEAMEAERIIKGWLRQKKLDLIRTINPTFRDLSEDWHE
jgi:putative endonuclease